MDEMKGLNSQPGVDGNSLLDDSPAMSVEESVTSASVASLPMRVLRAALAGLAVSGLGYYALASSPELNDSFTKFTGLSLVDHQPASCSVMTGGCGTAVGCGNASEMLVSGSGPAFIDDPTSCCPSTLAETKSPLSECCSAAAGECCSSGVASCTESCPASVGEQVASSDGGVSEEVDEASATGEEATEGHAAEAADVAAEAASVE